MARSLRGLTEGLQAGLRLGGAIRGARQRQALAEEAAKYGVTEGAYGPELQQNIQQLEGLKTQDPAQAAAYDQAIGELQRRAQMTAPDFSIASGQQTFGTREEAARAARPMRAEGLARVYEQYGDAEQAEAMRERADAGRLREIQFRQAQLGLEDKERAAASAKRIDDFGQFRTANPDLTVAQLKDAARTQFNLNDAELLSVTANIAGLQENELKIWKSEVTDAIKGKNLNQLIELYNTDDRFDPTTDMRITRKGGRVNVAIVDKATGQQISSEGFESDAAAREYLRRQALEPDTLADWMLKRRELESTIGLNQARALEAGQARPRQMSEADITTRARAMVDLGTPDPDNPNNTLSFAKALQIVRQEAVTGVPYESQADRLTRQAIENPPTAAAATPAAAATTPAAPTRGLFTDPQGRTQLLEPFSRFGDWRRRLVEEANARDAASGLSSAGF